MKKSGDNEWCVGKQKSNKSTRDQNGAGERQKNVPFKKPQSLTLSARASFCDIASQWISFHCSRITFLAAAQVCGPFFVRSAAKSTPHKYGPISSVFRANTPEKRPRIEWKGIRPIERWGEVASRLFEILMALEVQKKIITSPRLDLRSEDNREIWNIFGPALPAHRGLNVLCRS